NLVPLHRKAKMARNRDLFDDTTMSFGEHLEVLRVHVFRALIGLIIAVTITLFTGHHIFSLLRAPIETVLNERGIEGVKADVPEQSFWEYVQGLLSEKEGEPQEESIEAEQPELSRDELEVTIDANQAIEALQRAGMNVRLDDGSSADSQTPSSSTNDEQPGRNVKTAEPTSPPRVKLILSAPEFAQFRRVVEDSNRVTTLKVEEGFLVYVKVCFISGFILASPWVFYQLWLFVAAGLYPHERKYVYVYLPMSIFLFVAGAFAGYYYAFPLMLQFLTKFNDWLGIGIQPRLSEYISLALMLPLMFGVSFQLPLVMLFLERIHIFDVEGYRKNRRMAILVIAILSMLLTPSDPGSMLLMMFPLIFLYEVGIYLCRFQLVKTAAPIQ
ncbi:MAG: twin-arginine translocase subunit TatC, partial [Planctomycetaceae bacterium]|nr:twin-arginine translocase subunit TatC [Planctomycetaceae bacterium]